MTSCNPSNLNGTNFTDPWMYIIQNQSCDLNRGFINYFAWQFYTFNNRVSPSILMFFWLLVLLQAISITADRYFAPCLVVVTKFLRMSDNLAGVTLLALGNGAPDVFSALSAITSANAEMAFGSILGAGIYDNTIVAGIIMLMGQFNVTKRPVCKDLLFYFIAVTWCMIVIIRKQMELWTAIVFLIIYVTYVSITVVSRLIYIQINKGKVCIMHQKPIEILPEDKINGQQKKLNNILNLSKKDIENFQNPKLTDINPAILEHNSSSTFTKSTIEVLHPNMLHPRMNSTTLSFRSSGRNIVLRRIGSTSHRDPGALVNLVMEKELEHQGVNEISIKGNGDFKQNTLSIRIPRNASISSHRTIQDKGISNINFPKSQQRPLDIQITRPIPTISIDTDKESPTINNIDCISTENQVEGYYVEFPGILKHFLLTISPVDIEIWSDKSIISRIRSIIQSPIIFILTLTIPVVDSGAFMRGWCKILNVLHCVTSLLISVFIINVALKTLGSSNFLVVYLILIIGVGLSLLVWFTSKADKAPVYHIVYAFIGLITSIIWIYEIANEIVNVLTVYGSVFSIPTIVLGFTVLAFANSLGDLVADTSLARKGFPAIGYAACIGGPLFNLLLGIGMPFTIKTAGSGTIPVAANPLLIMLIFTALLVTVMNMIALPLQKFHLRKIYGIILISLFVVYLILMILFSAKVINVNV